MAGAVWSRGGFASGAAVWRNVFLAEISNPAAPKVTLAQRAVVVTENDVLRMHLESGSQQETDPSNPNQYTVSTFDQTDIPIPIPQTDNKDVEPVPVAELPTVDLRVQAGKVKKFVAPWYFIEFHRRFALPTSCLVLALVGIPLGLSSKKGGKSGGFVLTILLVFAYYSVTLIGVSLARQGKIPPSSASIRR